MTTRSNAELVHRHHQDLVNRGDLGAADRDRRPDFVDHAAPQGIPVGPEATKAWISMVREGSADITVSDDVVITQGEMVAVHDGLLATLQEPAES